jgi:hypothetical protein
MTDNNQTLEIVDPLEDAATTLLYGDPEVAKEKLRTAVMHGAAQMHAHQSRAGAINRELESSKAVAEAFANENPDWAKDPMVVDAVKAGMRVEQLVSTRPLLVESAPYFPALVASSWSASPMACAATAVKRSMEPCMAMREPMRSGKCASWARIRFPISTPFHSFRTGSSRLAESAWMRSEKRSMKSSGFLATVWWAIASTTLSRFLAR